MIELSIAQIVTAVILIAMCSGMVGLAIMAALALNKQLERCEKCTTLTEHLEEVRTVMHPDYESLPKYENMHRRRA